MGKVFHISIQEGWIQVSFKESVKLLGKIFVSEAGLESSTSDGWDQCSTKVTCSKTCQIHLILLVILGNFTTTDLNLSNYSLDLVGCPLEYKWCETTPPIHLISYFAVSSLAFGIAMPILSIN